ncbi:4Fe-4S dicluster domain-containing protein [Consotaella salsifontis]|uniref:4Fe-4S dicluster domain-containing protein n=1 Tax=Consotaella salsifontis TaxID=1365950 RepID=A0A1T4S8B2_9HYPH|nr:4Fe-4S dicluster domain-containing protein [Consotaella salsifontis]SKA24560.1 4Fe-4S dicluster domain-containing protein [Consotaella salsifontis]
MALQILAAQCSVCGACEFECPNAAIKFKKGAYRIDPSLCTECEGFHDSPQCVEVCPVPDTCVPARPAA